MTAFSEEGRAWAASPTARANRPGFGALGRAGARRPGGRPRPPEAGAIATSLAHQGRTLSYAAPPPPKKSPNNRPAPQTTGLSRPGRPPHRAHRSAPPPHVPGVTPREEVAGNPIKGPLSPIRVPDQAQFTFKRHAPSNPISRPYPAEDVSPCHTT